MSVAEHRQAVRQALRSGEEMRRLINRLGTRETPNGRVLTAYRQARRAMAQAATPVAVAQVLAELRRTLAEVFGVVLTAAAEAGTAQARTELAVYGLPNVGASYTPTVEPQALLAEVDAQLNAVQAMYVATGDLAPILGDEERVGMLSPGPVVREGARWIGVAALAAYVVISEEMIDRTRRREDFLRQAVAAIDERTTDCCLQVHGQVVGMNQDFRLDGTPRFASALRNPPFHWYCRSSVCLVRVEDAQDSLSQEMRDAAQLELAARGNTGMRVEIDPADARSRR